MSAEHPEDEAAEANGSQDPGPGVFGNLPRTRPGARSPRRTRDETSRKATARPVPERAPAGPADVEPTEAQGPSPGPSEPVRPQPRQGAQSGGVEDVAWAGVAAAAEAATIGVRLATRALEAMRDAVDRR